MKFIKLKLASVCGILWMVFFSAPVFAQAAGESAPPRKFVSRTSIIQTLAAEVESLRVANSKLNDSLSSVQVERNAYQQENQRLQKDVKQLEQNLDNALNEKLQSSHTNSVLFIFVFITGLIVLLALIWLFMRKPATIAHYQDTRTNLEDDEEDDENQNTNSLDHQMERIEKLGSLREKGLLTDEEFNLQKKQILGERH